MTSLNHPPCGEIGVLGERILVLIVSRLNTSVRRFTFQVSLTYSPMNKPRNVDFKTLRFQKKLVNLYFRTFFCQFDNFYAILSKNFIPSGFSIFPLLKWELLFRMYVYAMTKTSNRFSLKRNYLIFTFELFSFNLLTFILYGVRTLFLASFLYSHCWN